MITKVCHFKGKDRHGNVFVEHFVPGEMIKTAAPMHPDILAFMATVKPDPNLVYVLVNALGASEVWGQNINGDVFPEYALTHVPDGWDQIPVGAVDRRMAAVTAMSPQYGHTTFYNSNAFKHHANKDPNKGFGRVVMTAWNDSMKRVEIIIALDRRLAEINGATDIIEKIENGEYPDVSMGCKVPFDICTICGHKSKTRNDYCEHAKNMMGKILPDGRIVGVINTLPRFFDISFVFIGADRTAKVMAKLAAVDQYAYVPEAALYLPSAEVAYHLGYEKTAEITLPPPIGHKEPHLDRRRIERTVAKGIEEKGFIPGGEAGEAALNTLSRVAGRAASRAAHLPSSKPVVKATSAAAKKVAIEAAKKVQEKRAAQLKLGDIDKMIEDDPASGKIMKRLERADADLPTNLLDSMSCHGDGSKGMGELLSSAGSLGIVLKPREFQRIILIRIGQKPMADDLDRRNCVFGPVDEIDDSVPMGGDHIADVIRHLLAPHMGNRSCLSPIFRRRVISVARPGSSGISRETPPIEEKNAILDKVAAAYNGYRMGLIGMAPEIITHDEVDGRVLEALHADDLIDAFSGEKTAGLGPVTRTALPLLLALGPLIYLSASHWKAQEELKGEKLPLTKKLIADHPVISAALAIGGTGRAAVGLDQALAKAAPKVVRALA